MATSSMVSSLSPAPEGIDFSDMIQDDTPAVEIIIENPDDVIIGIDGMAIDLMPEEEESFEANLAEFMDEGELEKLGSDLVGEVESDISSRKEWVEMYVRGLEVLGMKYEERTEPWTGACGVFSTLLTEAAVRFQSETIIETFPAQGPVKTQIIGAIDKLKEDAAERVRTDMNFQLVDGMPEYRPEHERMLFNLGLAGSAFKKVYFDPGLGRQVAIFCPAEDIVIPYGSSGARSAERVTHVMRKTKNDVKKLQVAGFYRDVELGEPVMIHNDVEKKKAEEQGYSVTEDERYQFLEIQVDYDMPGYEDKDGIALPYIVTIDKGTSKVLSVYRNWNETDKKKIKRQHFVQYDYVPGFGAYGFGYIHLIGGYARAGTSLIRQLVDAGTLSNLPGGLKSRGLRIKGDDTPIAPGEWRDVDVPGGTVRDNIMPLPYKEPSQVLAVLLDRITEEGRRLGSIADMNISDMSANSPVGTTLALLERQLKTMSAVQARVHYAMKQEFKLLKEIIRDNTPSEYEYEPQGGDRMAKREDYDMVEVIPVSDPNSSTMAQRIMQYQAVIQLAAQAPQIYDLPQLHRQMIEVLGIKNADKLVPIDDDMKPRDPVSENMAFLNGKPTKAFIYQDHDAHIAVHMALMQDPLMAAQIGQNPQAQKMQAEIMAHISEHLAFAYRKKVEEQLGVPMPKPDEDLPEDVEVQLSRLVAQASQQVLAQSKGQAAQQQAQQQAQDPLVQMQQQELQIKMKDASIKEQKVQGDLAVRQQELQLKAQEAANRQGENPEVAAAKMQQEMIMDRQLHEQEMAQRQQEFEQKMSQKQQEASAKMQAKLMERLNRPAAKSPEN
jgi:chaperonin GroES